VPAGIGNQELGDGNLEIGNRRQEMGNGSWKIGDGNSLSQNWERARVRAHRGTQRVQFPVPFS
jgi:hypothetical protein